MGRRLRWATLIAAIVAMGCAAPALAAVPGQNGKIAYQAGGSVYSINPDGTAQQLVVGEAFGPSWSPDGTRLAIVRRGSEGLDLVNADGTGRTPLTNSGDAFGDYGPDWSPDGTRLVFSRFFFDTEESRLGMIGADGSGERLLPFGNSALAWSPAGQRLAYTVERSMYGGVDEDGNPIWIFESEIWTANLDGSGAVQVARGPIDFDGDWSPDGSQIVFTHRAPPTAPGPGPADTVYIVNADGTGPRFLTTGFDPSWSPDGTRIAFSRGSYGISGEIYTIRTDGADLQRVTSLDDGQSAIQPDWQRLASPQRGDYKNAAKFCRAERQFWGEQRFRERYGGSSSAHGKCVSSS